MKTKFGTVIILVITALLVSSCTTKFLYNYLDWALEWYVDDLVTLNEDQEWQLRDALKSTLEWHRKNQIPFYIKSLEEAEQAVKTEITHEFLKRFYFLHEKGWMELKYHLTPVLSGLLKTLNDSQIEQLRKNLREQEDELAEQYVNKPTQQLIEERTERMIEKIENWTGDLNPAQKQIVTDWSRNVEFTANQWSQSRQDWQSTFVKIVKTSRNTPEFNSLMMEHFQNSRKYWPEGYRASYYRNIDLTLLMIVNMSKKLSQKQRKTLLGKISGLKEQFIEIYNDN